MKKNEMSSYCLKFDYLLEWEQAEIKKEKEKTYERNYTNNPTFNSWGLENNLVNLIFGYKDNFQSSMLLSSEAISRKTCHQETD